MQSVDHDGAPDDDGWATSFQVSSRHDRRPRDVPFCGWTRRRRGAVVGMVTSSSVLAFDVRIATDCPPCGRRYCRWLPTTTSRGPSPPWCRCCVTFRRSFPRRWYKDSRGWQREMLYESRPEYEMYDRLQARALHRYDREMKNGAKSINTAHAAAGVSARQRTLLTNKWTKLEKKLWT